MHVVDYSPDVAVLCYHQTAVFWLKIQCRTALQIHQIFHIYFDAVGIFLEVMNNIGRLLPELLFS